MAALRASVENRGMAPSKRSASELTDVDVLVVGAGLSGIAAGYHLQDKCPV